jgi:hypothetical protein
VFGHHKSGPLNTSSRNQTPGFILGRIQRIKPKAFKGLAFFGEWYWFWDALGQYHPALLLLDSIAGVPSSTVLLPARLHLNLTVVSLLGLIVQNETFFPRNP